MERYAPQEIEKKWQEKWQKGTPQSMHREAWRFRSAEPSARLSRISFQSRMRTSTGRSAGSSRLR